MQRNKVPQRQSQQKKLSQQKKQIILENSINLNNQKSKLLSQISSSSTNFQNKTDKTTLVMTQSQQKYKSTDIIQILKNLYISDDSIANDKQFLKSFGIQSIVVCGKQLQTPFSNKNSNKDYQIQYLHIPVRDHKKQQINQYFDNSFQFIQENLLKNKRVLVHCKMGVSRSATILIAYLIRKCVGKYQDCYNFVKNKKISIKPNQGFVVQLQVYSKCIRQNAKQVVQKNLKLKAKTQEKQQKKQTETQNQQSKTKTISVN